jgi:hypothetical protein
MNLIQQFPNISRRERRKPVDHGPDNLDFWKQLAKDSLLMLVVTIIGGVAIAVITAVSIKGGW